jgi:hypothetical protein
MYHCLESVLERSTNRPQSATAATTAADTAAATAVQLMHRKRPDPELPLPLQGQGSFTSRSSSPGTPFDSALCGYRLFRTSRLVVQTAGSIVLALRVYFDLEIICSTIFDSWLRNWEWHKEKKHRHPHLNLNLLLPKPVDA